MKNELAQNNNGNASLDEKKTNKKSPKDSWGMSANDALKVNYVTHGFGFKK